MKYCKQLIDLEKVGCLETNRIFGKILPFGGKRSFWINSTTFEEYLFKSDTSKNTTSLLLSNQ